MIPQSMNVALYNTDTYILMIINMIHISYIDTIIFI